MCRAWTIHTIGEKKGKEAACLMMQALRSSVNKGNEDGYYLAAVDEKNNSKSITTLDQLEAYRFLAKNSMPYVGIGHARKQTCGKIDKDNVHGWKFGDYTTMCNGTVTFEPNYGKGHDNDSRAFFIDVFERFWDEDPSVFIRNIIKYTEEAIEYGSGTFFLVGPEKTLILTFNGSREIAIDIVNGEHVIYSSKDDVIPMHLPDNIELSYKVKTEDYNLGALTIPNRTAPSHKYRFNSKIEVDSLWRGWVKNCALVVDNATGMVDEKIDVNFRFGEMNPKVSYKKTMVPSHGGWSSKDDDDWRKEIDDEDVEELMGHMDDLTGKYRQVSKALEN